VWHGAKVSRPVEHSAYHSAAHGMDRDHLLATWYV